MVPQAGAVTPVGQVTVHVAVWSLDPETKALNGWVVLVITLAVVGEIAMVMDVAVVPPPPQPKAPNPSARVKIKQNFHGLMPVLPQKTRQSIEQQTLRSVSTTIRKFTSSKDAQTQVRATRNHNQNVRLTVNRNVRIGSKKLVRCGLFAVLMSPIPLFAPPRITCEKNTSGVSPPM